MRSNAKGCGASAADDLPRDVYRLADRIGTRTTREVAGEVLRLVQSRKYTARQIGRRVAAKAWRKGKGNAG